MPIGLRPLLKPSYTLEICLDCTYNAWNDEFTWIRAAESLRHCIRALHWGKALEPSQILNILSPAPRISLVRVLISVPRAYLTSATIQVLLIVRYNLPSLYRGFFLYTRAYSSPGKCKRSVRGRVSRGENRYDCSNRERVTISSMQIKAAYWPDPGNDDGYVVHSYHVHPRVGRRETSR